MAERKSGKTGTQKSRTTAAKQESSGWTDEEREAMKERAES